MRISWIDNLRWLWIILIVMWHSYFPDSSLLVKYLFSFHVILFFFLSWYLYNDEKHNDIVKFIKNKLNRLIIPFIMFNIIMFSYYKFAHIAFGTEYNVGLIPFIKWLLYWIYIPTHPDFILANVPTWFLVSLFMVSIYYFVINKFIKNRYNRIALLFTISILIYIESKNISFRLPWSMEISAMATLFYWIWHSFKQEISNFVNKINYYYLLLIPILVWFNLLFLSWTNFSTNFYWNNYLIFLLDWISGTITFIILSKIIWENSILSFLWKNSIIVLGMEWIKFLVLSMIIRLSFGNLVFEKSYLIWFVQLFSTFVVLIPIIFIINKYFQFILGFNGKKSVKYKKSNF